MIQYYSKVEDFDMEFKEQVKTARQKMGLSQTALAR